MRRIISNSLSRGSNLPILLLLEEEKSEYQFIFAVLRSLYFCYAKLANAAIWVVVKQCLFVTFA
jgi:hypothetical protein